GRLYLPGTPEDGPYPAAVFMHQYSMDSGEAEKVLPAAREAGVAILAIDLEYHGARAVAGRELVSPLVYTTRDAMIQGVFDIRRAMDFLDAREDIKKPEKGYAIIKFGVTMDMEIRRASNVDTRVGSIIIAQETVRQAMEIVEKIKIDDMSRAVVVKAFSGAGKPEREVYAAGCINVKNEEGYYASTPGMDCTRAETVAEALSSFAEQGGSK
ncbi:hypothetical protein ACFLQK_02690, partial [bacterium]